MKTFKGLNSQISRRDFLKVTKKFGFTTAVMTAYAGIPLGASVTEAAAQVAATDKERRAQAQEIMVFAIDGTLDRYPDGPVSKETIYTNGSAMFKDRVETLSGGRIYVDLKVGGVLGYQPGEKIRQGVIQAGTMTTQNCSSLVPMWNVLDFPFVVGTSENMAKLFYSKEFNDTLRKESEAKGLICLGGTTFMRWINLGPSVKETVRRPGQMAGLKIRASNSRLELAGLQSLGSNPTPISGGEVVSAMEQGVIDGFNIGPHLLTDFGFIGAVTQLIDTQFMPNTDCIFVNSRWMRGLSAEDQEAIMEASFERQQFLIDVGGPVYRDQVGVAPDSPEDSPIRKSGITVSFLTEDERNEWKDAMSFKNFPEFNELADQFGRKELEMVQEIAAQGDATPRRWWT